MATFTNQTKHNSTFTDRNISFPGLYGVARYGVSTYGTATSGQGMFTNQTKNSSSFNNQTKH